MSEQEIKDVTVRLEQTGIGNLIKVRKPQGTLGRPAKLWSNSFPLVWNLKKIFRYVVEFTPEISPQEVVRRRIALAKFGAVLFEHYGVNVFDGTCILATKEVSDHLQFSAGDENILVRPIKVIDTSDVKQLLDPEVNTIVNVILKKFLRIMKLIKLGRNYYTPNPTVIEAIHLGLYRGYSAAVEPTIAGLALNIDAVHRIVKQSTVRDLMDQIEAEVYEQYYNLPEAKQYEMIEKRVHEALSGASVLTSHNKMLWRIDFVDWNRSAESKFPMSDGKEISFAQYYAEKYKKRIDTVRPGVLIHIPKKKKRENDEIVLMPEFCHLTGLTDAERGDFRLMQAIANETHMKPGNRLRHIQQLIKDLGNSREIKEQMQPLPFHLSISEKPLDGRILGPFKVSMNSFGEVSKTDVAGNKSNFGNIFRSMGMMTSTPIKKWAVVYNQNDENLASQFVYNVLSVAQKQGLDSFIGEPEYCPLEIRRGGQGQTVEQQWMTQVNQVINQVKPDLLAAVIPDNPPAIYTAVKKICCVENPVISQVVLTRNLKNPKKIVAVCGNTLKQMLTKMGGIPWKVDITLPKSSVRLTQAPSMIVGVDVCHDRKLGRSVVGFCASYSADFCQYNSFISFQRQGEEIVGASSELMKRALVLFAKHHPLPHHVLVYRDGVSNSQLDTVVKQEITGYKQAFKSVKPGYDPKLTVVVVQKRVSQRFFTAADISESPVPGTVIDTGIVSPHFSDFFLVPCEAHPNAGTATPTRFIVVWDDCGFQSDDIQNITNQFCLMYFNWPGPIRVPAPCMYAHKIAFLIGKHIPDKEPSGKLNGKLFYL